MTQANAISPSGNMILGDKYPIVPVNAVVKHVRPKYPIPGMPAAVAPAQRAAVK